MALTEAELNAQRLRLVGKLVRVLYHDPDAEGPDDREWDTVEVVGICEQVLPATIEWYDFMLVTHQSPYGMSVTLTPRLDACYIELHPDQEG